MVAMEWVMDILCLTFICFFFGKTTGSQFNLYHAVTANFEQAKDYCMSYDRVLAKIDSSTKHKKIKNLKPYMDGHFWIGLKANVEARNHTWIDSTDLEFSKWATGFPEYVEGLECVRMRSDDYKWENFNCSEKLNFLCENKYFKPSSTVSTSTKLKGIFMGIGVIGGLLTLVCLLLQLPCCRANVTDKIADLGFGTHDLDRKQILN